MEVKRQERTEATDRDVETVGQGENLQNIKVESSVVNYMLEN